MQVQELVGIVPWNFIATICNLFIQVYLIKRKEVILRVILISGLIVLRNGGSVKILSLIHI